MSEKGMAEVQKAAKERGCGDGGRKGLGRGKATSLHVWVRKRGGIGEEERATSSHDCVCGWAGVGGWMDW